MLAQFVFVSLWLRAFASQQISPVVSTSELILIDCASEYGMPPHELANALLIPRVPDRPTASFKCAVYCFMTRMGYMTADGYIDMDIVQANLKSAGGKVYESILYCKNVPASNRCDRAFAINKCTGLKIFQKELQGFVKV